LDEALRAELLRLMTEDQAPRRAGLPSCCRPYDLRHAYAAMLFAAGEHPKVVSGRPGHASVALTLDTYTHAVRGLRDDSAAKVQRLIRGGERPDDESDKGA
jgi:integrase